MIQLFMSRSGSSVIVPLNLPASHGAMTEAYSQLEQANRTGKTEIVEIKSVIANLPSYLGGLDPDSRTQLAQLNLLSSIIAKMDSRERSIYAGALDGNSINDLNDMIRVAEQVSDYILIPNVNSDVTLGRYVAVAGQIQGDPRFPEAAWPYLDFAKIGAEYYAEHGGAYTHAGYVLLKQDAEPVREKAAKIRLDLSSSQAQASVSLPALKEELERVKKLLGMSNYCHKNGGTITEDSRSFGYVAETDHYRYCLRCTPTPGDYQGYLYCYDKRQQEMAQKDNIVGRVTFADGTTQEFTDPHQYLQTIKEELPLRNTTGFKHETLSEDPEIKKAVDDILLDFAGEENPRRTCNYGLTEKGLQALRDVADPSLPHSYAWFVMTDCNTPQEQLHRNLTLDEAVELYQSSDHPEKRLGVTKDDFATVDFVRMADGEQTFFGDYQKLENFKNDPTIFEAVEQLHQELEVMSQDQGMTM